MPTGASYRQSGWTGRAPYDSGRSQSSSRDKDAGAGLWQGNFRRRAYLLEHIVRNLVSNAIKYTNKGKILVGCRRDADTIRIEVHDTGVGIAPDDLDKIFGEFHRVDPAHGEGRGLGLAIAKQMADLLGHRVTVHARRGRGTCFGIAVPRT